MRTLFLFGFLAASAWAADPASDREAVRAAVLDCVNVLWQSHPSGKP